MPCWAHASAALCRRSQSRRRNLALFLATGGFCGPEGRKFESCWARQTPSLSRRVIDEGARVSTREERVFNPLDNPTAKLCYARAVDGWVTAVLHPGPVD